MSLTWILENVRSRLETELEQYRSATANETSETNTLKSRITSLESANRDTLALLESKTSSYENLSQELSAQHQKVVELRKQITALEQSVQTANSSVASAKFKEQSLQQEVDMLKKNNEWLENERKIKGDEHTTFRKEKNARISELSRSNEQYISEIETLRRSETSLKYRLEDQTSKFEDLLEEKQKLQEEHMSSEDALRREVDAIKRLADLQQATAETAKERVQELSAALDEARADAADEIGALRAESETEHADKLAAEERIAELETTMEQLRNELEESRARPSTPQRPMNGTPFSTPLRPGTPSGIFSPSTISRPKAQMTMTQLFSEYKKLEGELASEKRASEQLRSNLDAMVEELENNKPEIEELRMDHDRLQSEVVEMSTIVEQANTARDRAAKELRTVQGQFESKSKEAQALAQQLRDLGTQIRFLLIEQHVKEQGGGMTREDFDQLELQANQAMEEDMTNLSETQQVINQRLIAFKNIAELQRQNEDQLKTIRNLVTELESNVAKEKEQQNHALQQELENTRQTIASYKDELKSQMAQSKSFAKERDMLRNMLTRRGQLPGGIQPNDFSKSLPIPPAESPASVSGESDYAKLLKDVQQHFDSFRQESSTDRTALKAQVDDLSRKNSQLQTDISRTVGQLTAANQRYEMLQLNYNSLKAENGEIQKRSWTAMENATKQELRTQQVAEELVEARGLLDSLRRDSANLKAEKDLWKSVERRLIEDNESLRNERSRLDSLNASLQTMINEREQTDAESRRRLQSQTESLESELQATKRKLNDEMEEAKKLSLRREYEHGQSQKRIDDLVTSLSSTKEELASAKTAREHLQARVDEMTVELRSAEERIEVLTRPAEPAADATTEQASLSKEQELEVEVSELKRDLELKVSELERANEQVEVYKSISQSSEERLQELSETNDQYHEETGAALAEKDAKIKDLEQRIEDISAELSTTNSELSRLRDEQAEADRRLDEQRAAFNSDIERLKEEAEKSAEQAQFNLEASKIQAQIATDAQQNYESELVKHAEAAKTLQSIRDDANQLRLQMVDLKTQAETSKANLEQKSISWDEMKDRFEREIADLKKRREEVSQQNNILHSQLENVTQQITALQRDRAALTEGQNSEPTAQSTAELDKLQEVITYLRREKDIVDVQYQLSTQEAKRLRQQLEFAQSQLDETRLKLDQQRRAEADAERNALSHNKLMDTLNELNLFRESSVTLRAEAKQATQALSEKSKRVEELEGELQTLNARVAELENLVELREGELKLSQEDRDHWQQRTQNILSKYDRVDPAELEALKENITSLESERDQARSELNEAVAEREQAKAELQAQIDGQQVAIKESNADLRSRLSTQFKEVVQKNKAALNEVKAQLDAAIGEKEALQVELDSTKEQLETSQAEAAAAPQPQVNGDHGKPPTEASAAADRISELEAKVAELQAALAAKEKEVEDLQSMQEEKFKTRVAAMEKVLNGRLKEVKQEAQQAKATALEELATRLTAQHQQELEAARSQDTTTAPESHSPTDETAQSAAPESQKPTSENVESTPSIVNVESLSNEALSAAVTKPQLVYLAKFNQLLKDLVSNTIVKRVEQEKQNLQKKFEETAKAQNERPVPEQTEELETRLQAQREAIILEEETKFNQEKANLIHQHEESLAREKQSLIIKHQEELTSQKLQFDEESSKKIAEQVKNAELLWEKRGAVKLNMAQRNAQLANAKIEVVKKAAEETPTKPVSEVWEIAKDAKPPAPQPKPAAAPPAASTTAPTANALPAAPASTTAQPAAQAESKPNTDVSTQPAQPAQPAEPATPIAADNKIDQQVSPTEPAKQPQQTQGPNALQQLQSGIPRGGAFRGRGGSGIPRGRGGQPRGGGRGGAQGGNPQQSNRGGHGPGSPSRGALNPQAAQFTPGGNKRARDDGGADDVNQGKRFRGEAGPA